MSEIIHISQLYKHPGLPVIDVRSPAEYEIAHIPGAVNIPLFDNEERARVGTRYAQAGKEAGFLLGLEIAGPKLAGYVKKLNSLFPVHSPLVIYCWRGGMRSNAMAWLFSQAGHEVKLISGGYKAYRGYIREQITTGWDFRVIGGMTGSGKTEVLGHIRNLGYQVLDLEDLASHKGSVFGHLGQGDQPNNEWFENQLWERLRQLDASIPVFVEDESRSIGKVSMPEPFYMKLQQSRLYLLEVDFEDRVHRLVEEYGLFPKKELKENIDKLLGYLGSEAHKKTIALIEEGHLDQAAGLLLKYYDKKYRESIVRYRKPEQILSIDTTNGDSYRNAKLILEKMESYGDLHFHEAAKEE